MRLARQIWGIYPTTLPDVCRRLRLPLDHHDPLSDAKACAKIIIKAIESGIEVVFHIPHSSARIPDKVLKQYLLSRSELERELLLMTDWYADELFALPEHLVTIVKFPVSRLVVDPERFRDDAREPMSAKGMGAVYLRTSGQGSLRRPISNIEREALLSEYYDPHHQVLNEAVGKVLSRSRRCLIIDAHSFPSVPLSYEDDQRPDRPEICIGTDGYHTPARLGQLALDAFKREFESVAFDRPFSGALVPLDYYQKEDRVRAVMIEVNRALYMDERIGEKLPEFKDIRKRIQKAVARIIEQAG